MEEREEGREKREWEEREGKREERGPVGWQSSVREGGGLLVRRGDREHEGLGVLAGPDVLLRLRGVLLERAAPLALLLLDLLPSSLLLLLLLELLQVVAQRVALGLLLDALGLQGQLPLLLELPLLPLRHPGGGGKIDEKARSLGLRGGRREGRGRRGREGELGGRGSRARGRRRRRKRGGGRRKGWESRPKRKKGRRELGRRRGGHKLDWLWGGRGLRE